MNTWDKLSDMELVALLKAGNQYAYTAIYERYKSPLYVFALKRLEQADECKDLVHELFLSLWVRREEIVITGSLSAYLYTSVRNRILDIIAHREISDRYVRSFQHYIDHGENNTDHLVRHKELLGLIEKELAAMPPRMRQIFELSRQTHYTRKEIAERLGLSEQTVKSHIQHALKLLKEKLGMNGLALIIFMMTRKYF